MPARCLMIPVALFVGWFIGACGGTPSRAVLAAPTARPFEVFAAADFPANDARSHELSGVTWDEAHGVAHAISDGLPQIVQLRPTPDYRSWSLSSVTPVAGVDPWDGEGIALAGARVFVANERPPRIVELNGFGAGRSEFVLPSYFESCRPNRCLESLSVTGDGRYLFTANESAPISDAEPSVELGAAVRIVRFDLATGTRREWSYLTDPVCAPGPDGEVGVSDLVALGIDDLLVLERSYVPNTKNRVRVYRVHLGLNSVPLRKDLFFDVASLDTARPFVPNYEGMGLGPRLPDGRRLLLMVSDDNAHLSQRATLLAIAAQLGE